MNTLTHLSLCTGIGGIDLAAEWAGFKTVAQCEIDDYASRVLAKNFKGVPNLNDIRTVDNARLRAIGVDPEAITLLSAGFPCQPYSLAGKGRGDGDERDLWGEVKRCIGEIKPRWFVGENTPGLFARANQRYFKRILADLAEMGYRVSWGIWGACDVGAPHKRARVFICAHRHTDGELYEKKSEVYAKNTSACGVRGNVSDAVRERSMDKRTQIDTTEIGESTFGNALELCSSIPDTASDELGLYGSAEETQKTASCGSNNRRRTQGYAIGERWETEPDVGRVVDGIFKVLYGDRINEQVSGKKGGTKKGSNGKMRNLRVNKWAKPTSCRLQRLYGSYRAMFGLSCKNTQYTSQKSGDMSCVRQDIHPVVFNKRAQTMQSKMRENIRKNMCNETLAWWEMEPAIPRVTEQIKNRVDKLRCLGNAVVPQQIYPLLKEIADYEIQGD